MKTEKKIGILAILNFMKKGIFYAVSTGAGNPELLTLQAIRTLRECEIIFYPKSEKNTIALDSLASTAEIDLSKKLLVPCSFSMTSDKEKSDSEYKKIAGECAELLQLQKNVAMVSIGDVSLYSTAARTARHLQESGFEVKFIAGVNSFSEAACQAAISLCEKDEALSVIPADSFFTTGKLEDALNEAGTKVLMKMGRHLKEIIQILQKLNLIKNSILVQKASRSEQKIFKGEEILNMSETDFEEAYLSVLIVKKTKTNQSN